MVICCWKNKVLWSIDSSLKNEAVQCSCRMFKIFMKLQTNWNTKSHLPTEKLLCCCFFCNKFRKAFILKSFCLKTAFFLPMTPTAMLKVLAALCSWLCARKSTEVWRNQPSPLTSFPVVWRSSQKWCKQQLCDFTLTSKRPKGSLQIAFGRAGLRGKRGRMLLDSSESSLSASQCNVESELAKVP